MYHVVYQLVSIVSHIFVDLCRLCCTLFILILCQLYSTFYDDLLLMSHVARLMFEPPWIIDQGSDVQIPSANFLPEIFWVSARKATLDRRTSIEEGKCELLSSWGSKSLVIQYKCLEAEEKRVQYSHLLYILVSVVQESFWGPKSSHLGGVIKTGSRT